ncbi:MAG: serine hydrolase domain-containing protein [Caulobacteraceae bacterium]
MSLEAVLAETAAANPIPGYVAAVVQDGEVVAEAASGEGMGQSTVFRIFSMTKAITTAAAMQLVERGKADLDAPASAYAPELAAVKVLAGFDDSGDPILREPARPVTLRDLLLHRSGFAYTMWNADLTRYMAWLTARGEAANINPYLDMPLVFDPGEMWEYGIGIDWAGRLVERISGQGLDAVFAENITGPLGMADTGFDATPSMAERLADMYLRTPDGALMAMPRNAPSSGGFFSGGGGLLSTSADYLTFLTAMAGDGSARSGRILKPETVAQMAHCDGGAPKVRALASHAPMLTNDLDIWGEHEARWSLGFLVNPMAGPHGRPAGSLAWAGLANTYYWIDRDRRLAGVFMTQLMPFADKSALAVFNALEREAYKLS